MAPAANEMMRSPEMTERLRCEYIFIEVVVVGAHSVPWRVDELLVRQTQLDLEIEKYESLGGVALSIGLTPFG